MNRTDAYEAGWSVVPPRPITLASQSAETDPAGGDQKYTHRGYFDDRQTQGEKVMPGAVLSRLAAVARPDRAMGEDHNRAEQAKRGNDERLVARALDGCA